MIVLNGKFVFLALHQTAMKAMPTRDKSARVSQPVSTNSFLQKLKNNRLYNCHLLTRFEVTRDAKQGFTSQQMQPF